MNNDLLLNDHLIDGLIEAGINPDHIDMIFNLEYIDGADQYRKDNDMGDHDEIGDGDYWDLSDKLIGTILLNNGQIVTINMEYSYENGVWF